MSSMAVPVDKASTVEPIKAVYRHLDCLLTGVRDLRAAGYRDVTVLTPFPRHEVEEMLYQGEPSPIRWVTLFGACFGATMAFSLTSLTHANWPMILPGGKPVVSVPPFLVITFEGTILWGSLFTLLGMLLMTRLPARDLPKAVEDPRFSNDCFGIVVERVGKTDASKVKTILSHSGADEVSGGDPYAAEGHAHG